VRTHRAENWLLLAVGIVLAGPVLVHVWSAPKVRAQGAAAPNADRFKAVKEWTLTYSYEFNDPFSVTAENGDQCKASVLSHSEQGRFILRPTNISEDAAEFEGEGEASVASDRKTECTSPGGDWYWLWEDRGEAQANFKASLHLDFDAGRYWIDFEGKPTLIGTIHRKTEERRPNGRHADSTTQGDIGWPGPQWPHQDQLKLPTDKLSLEGNYSLEEYYRDNGIDVEESRRLHPAGIEPKHGTFHWSAVPAEEDYEVVVDVKDYDKWLPEAGESQDTPGNKLEVHAKLQKVGGGEPAEKAKIFTLELLETSKEPGTCMNWPGLVAGQPDFDLKFSQQGAALQVSGDGQKVTTPPGQYTEANATITSFDWGAYGALSVTARLRSGREMVGHLRGHREMTKILLPKRKPNSHIADTWKQAEGVANAPDDDDDDIEPIGEERFEGNGDGLMLWEEYRGFIVDGDHIRTHPKRMDFFIKNRAGAVAAPGIKLFAAVTGLDVHVVRETEMHADRIINANHSGGAPHRVDQHGVVIVVDQSREGAWSVTAAGQPDRPGPPRYTEYIRIPAKVPVLSSEKLGAAWGLPTATGSKTPYFTKLVAHELLHTASVWHHGDSDYKDLLVVGYSKFDSEKHQRVGKPIIRSTVFEGPATLRLEDGTDMTPRFLERFAAAEKQVQEALEKKIAEIESMLTLSDEQLARAGATRAQLREYIDILKEDAESVLSHGFPLELKIGNEGGQHSGVEDCIMRYNFGFAYRSKQEEHTYYLVLEEVAGGELCRTGKGSGVNSPQHKPQSRYGDASQKRGDCKGQLMVNDAYDPSPR